MPCCCCCCQPASPPSLVRPCLGLGSRPQRLALASLPLSLSLFSPTYLLTLAMGEAALALCFPPRGSRAREREGERGDGASCAVRNGAVRPCTALHGVGGWEGHSARIRAMAHTQCAHISPGDGSDRPCSGPRFTFAPLPPPFPSPPSPSPPSPSSGHGGQGRCPGGPARLVSVCRGV